MASPPAWRRLRLGTFLDAAGGYVLVAGCAGDARFSGVIARFLCKYVVVQVGIQDGFVCHNGIIFYIP